MGAILKTGIDVSYAQGNIDFDKIDKSKVQFVIIRSSYGWEANQKDEYFDRNYQGLKKIGVPIGGYHYSYATNEDEATKEANYVLSIIKGKTFELPIYLDLEESTIAKKVGKSTMTKIAIKFCQLVEAAGYKAGVYCSLGYLDYIDIDKIVSCGYSFWMAQYYNTAQHKCDVWQHSDGAKVRGINGAVDENYMYTDVIKSKIYNDKISQLNSAVNVNCNVKVISSNGLNIRNGAGTSYNILGAIPCNTITHITKKTSGDGYTWGCTTYNGITGWIALEYTQQSSAKNLKVGSIVRIRKNACVYNSNLKLSDFCFATNFSVIELSKDRAVIGIGGKVTSAVNTKDLIVQ